MGDTNPLPSSLLDTAYYQISSGPPGAFVDSLTGEVAIQSGGLGAFTVLAYSSNNLACRDTQEISFNISNLGPSSVGYAPISPGYCPLDTNVGPLNLPVPSGGNFQSIPPVNWTTQALGHVNVATTPPGFYSLIYIPPHDSCAINDTVTIRIRSKETAVFDYQPVYCIGDTAAFPLISNLPSGNFVSTPPSASLDSATGEFSFVNLLDTAFTISFIPDSACADVVSDSFTVHVPPQINFEFLPDTVCKGTQFTWPDTLNLTPPRGTGTMFTDTSGYVVINPTTGRVDVGASTTGGPFYVFYSNGDPTCPDSITAPLTILPRDSFSIYYPKSEYCTNEVNPVPLFASGPTGGQFISTPATTALIDSTGEFNFSAFSGPNGSVFQISYISPNPDCQDIIVVDDSFVVNTPASAFFNFPGPPPNPNHDTLCAASGLYLMPVLAVGDTNGWVVNGPGGPIYNAVTNNFIDTGLLPPGGPYSITRWVSNGVCTDSMTRYITIEPRLDPSFYYVNDTLCGDVTPPVPLILGNGGGTFSLDTAASTRLTTVNPVTGLLNLDSSGTFVIRYTTPGNCPVTAFDTVVVLPANSAEFSFFGGPKFCTELDSIYIDNLVTANGVFSYSAAVPGDTIDLDTLTGTIYLATSQVGVYTIRYSVSNGICEQLSQTIITIVASDDSTDMYYVDSVFCPLDSVSPVLLGDSSGVFVGGPGINFSDLYGTINLAASLPSPTPYEIRYFISGDCPVDLRDTIEIQSAAPSIFDYGASFFCTTDTNPFPTFIATPGGTFFVENDFATVVPLIDTLTGEFYLDQVDSNNVTFYIHYNSGAGCTSEYILPITVFQGPDGANLEPDLIDPICEGDFIRFTASGSEVGYQWFLNGDSIPNAQLQGNQAVFEYDAFIDGSVVQVIFGNLAQCYDTLSRQVRVNPTPVIAIPDTAITVSGDQQVAIEVFSFLDNTMLDWVAESQANIDYIAETGSEGPVNNGGTYTITNQFSLTDSTSPALVIFTVTPVAFDCEGEPIQVYVKVNPDNQAIFVPELITPNGDNLNDRWLIQLRNDIRPEDYTMLLFNRSGGQVLRMNPLNQNFDGDFLPDGVYWYKLLGPTGNTLRTGGLTIRRK